MLDLNNFTYLDSPYLQDFKTDLSFALDTIRTLGTERKGVLTITKREEGMWLTEMHFYWWEENGQICVQNMIAGMAGQKHTHSKEGFKRWIKENQIEKRLLHKVK